MRNLGAIGTAMITLQNVMQRYIFAIAGHLHRIKNLQERIFLKDFLICKMCEFLVFTILGRDTTKTRQKGYY